MFRKIRFFVTAVFSVAFICFAVLNRQFISIHLFPLPYSADMPVFLFAVICFGCGMIAGGGFMSAKLSKIKRLLKREHKHVMALQNEIGGLRAEGDPALAMRMPRDDS